MKFNRETGYKPRRDFATGPKPKMHKAICSECGIGCEVPFKPAGQKPIFCRPCFAKSFDGAGVKPMFTKTAPMTAGKTFSSKSTGSGSYDEQFAILNAKLDMIINALAPKTASSFTKSSSSTANDEWAPRKFIKPKKEFKKWGKK